MRLGEPLVAGPGSDCTPGEAAAPDEVTMGDTERLEAPRFLLGGANSSAAMIKYCEQNATFRDFPQFATGTVPKGKQ